MQKLEIVKSDHVQELCDQAGFVMRSDSNALDAIARHFKVELPEERRLLVLGNRERVYSDPRIRILNPGEDRLPTPRGEGDILINLPEDDVVGEADLTLSVVRSLAERRANHVKHNTLRATIGTALGGVAVSFVGNMIAHNRITELAGYGLFSLGTGAAAHISTRQPKLPDNASLFDPPILLRPT